MFRGSRHISKDCHAIHICTLIRFIMFHINPPHRDDCACVFSLLCHWRTDFSSWVEHDGKAHLSAYSPVEIPYFVQSALMCTPQPLVKPMPRPKYVQFGALRGGVHSRVRHTHGKGCVHELGRLCLARSRSIVSTTQDGEGCLDKKCVCSSCSGRTCPFTPVLQTRRNCCTNARFWSRHPSVFKGNVA